jgi:beta-glucanase (GH16 family)
MSYPRALAAFVLSVALLPMLGIAPGNAVTAASGDASTQSPARNKAQRARITVLPKVSQKGRTDASADRARPVGEVRVWPATTVRKVQVQRSDDGGTTWSDLGSVKTTNAKGIAYFLPAPAATGSYWTYRAQVKKASGLPAFRTGQVTDRWSLLFEDQFAGSRLDRAIWSTRGDFYDKGSMRKCAKASPKLAQVGSGFLTLKVKKDPARRGDVCRWRSPGGKIKKFNYYLNGHVGTDNRFDFRHGVAAARVKFQQPQGMHGSFWMNTSGTAPQGTRPVEIDTVEFFGKGYADGGLAQFLHYQGRKIGGVQKSANDVLVGADNWWKKYHVFSVEWNSNGYVFRIDGKETFRTGKAISDKQVIMILSLLSSDWELDQMSETGKGSMKIDWVRVWQDPSLARNLQ